MKTTKQLENFIIYLQEGEKSKNTILKYKRDVHRFLTYVNKRTLTKQIVLSYKEELKKTYASTSINSMLAALNHFFDYLKKPELKVKPLKIQREIFSSIEKELTLEEYERLIKTAIKQNNKKLALIIQTICATGIRISELEYINISAINTTRANVFCKGKSRIVFLPQELCRMLKRYCLEENIREGSVFQTKSKKALDRCNIWRMMKKLCSQASVDENKVFPHNLRHLFARTYYRIEKDIIRLADILGHVSMDTTRIYTIESGHYHMKQLNKMNLLFTIP